MTDDTAALTFTAVQAEIDRRDGLADWRMMFQTLETRFVTGSFARGLDLVARIGAVAAELDHHPELDLRLGTLHVRLISRDVFGVTRRDLDLARRIGALATDLGVEADPGAVEIVEVFEDDADTDEAPEVVPAVVLPIAMERPIQTVGRRKEAVVRIRLMPGTGNFTLNGRTMDNYFPNKVHQQEVNEPFKVLELDNRYDVIARISGGGVSGQAGALRLGVARALNEADVDNNRAPLKKAGFLSRDDRAVERKKAGLKKARKAPQYSKR